MTKAARRKRGGAGQLLIPLIAIALLVIFNLIRDPSFFSIEIKTNNTGNTVLAGNLVSMAQTVIINKVLDNKEKKAAAVTAGEGSVK